jgi:hypothetical protein
MADVAGAELSVTPRAEDWVDVGDALPLRTHAVDLRVTETPDGGFIFELAARDGHVLEEPTVLIGEGGLSIRAAAA